VTSGPGFQNPGAGARSLLVLAGIVVIVAGLRTAAPILVPFLLSVFIATISATPMFWLQRRGVPTGLALLLVIGVLLVAGFGLGSVISGAVREFTQSIPFYEQRLRGLGEQGIALLAEQGIEVSRAAVMQQFDPGFAMRMVGRTMSGLTGVLSNFFLILITVSFILVEAKSFPSKLAAILDDPVGSMPRFAAFTETMNGYIAIKTATSVATGVVVYALNTFMGVDFAELWGLLAFLLNYIPNIGSFVAAVPAVLLASVQLGISDAAILAVAYFAINTLIGGVIEPRFMGQGLGLSTLVVWLSLVFWGWALGPVGMLLSVPLTVTLRIALENRPETHWLAVLMGPVGDAPPPPPEHPRFADADEMVAAAEAAEPEVEAEAGAEARASR
jgi:predicted PurR-regulated permease PerM